MLFVDVAATTLELTIHQFTERQVVALQVVDTMEGDAARGDWAGRMNGVTALAMANPCGTACAQHANYRGQEGVN